MTRPVGILGGLFDPVHFGHLRAALEVCQALDLAQVRLLPCGAPPHRGAPLADGAARLAMLEAAIAGEPSLAIDDRELRRAGPSYMVDTLASLREEQELGEVPLCLILGTDAFLALHTWHRWQALIELAHLVVVHRPGWLVPDAGRCAPEIRTLLDVRRVEHAAQLQRRAAGSIVLLPVTQLAISSTQIRGLIAAGKSPRYLLPEAVRELIAERNIYPTEEGAEAQ